MRRSWAAFVLAVGCHRGAPDTIASAEPAVYDCAELLDGASRDLDSGNLYTAARWAMVAAEECPDSADPFVMLGAVRWAEGDVRESTRLFEHALVLEPLDFGGSLALARNLAAQGRLARAAEVAIAIAEAERQDPYTWLTLMRIEYLKCDATRTAASGEAALAELAREDPMISIVEPRLAWASALRGRGPTCTVSGEYTDVPMHLDPARTLPAVDAIVDGVATRAALVESFPESWVSSSFVARSGLRPIGKVDLFGHNLDLVLLETIEVGSFTFSAVPAMVDPDPAVADVDLSLGYQVLHRIGAIAYDHARVHLILDRLPVPPSAADLDLVMAPLDVRLAPLVRGSFNGGESPFFAYVGGVDSEDVTVIAPVDSPRSLELGTLSIMRPSSRLAFEDKAIASSLDWLRENSGVEVAGTINRSLLQRHRVTYCLSEGRISIAYR